MGIVKIPITWEVHCDCCVASISMEYRCKKDAVADAISEGWVKSKNKWYCADCACVVPKTKKQVECK